MSEALFRKKQPNGLLGKLIHRAYVLQRQKADDSKASLIPVAVKEYEFLGVCSRISASILKVLIVVFCLIALSSCSLFQKKLHPITAAAKKVYLKALQEYEDDQPEQALQTLKKFEKKYSIHQLQWEIDLLRGKSLEKMRAWEKAALQYEKLSHAIGAADQRFAGEVVYRLAMAYQMQGQYEKSLAALLSVKPHLKKLDSEIRQVQWPAQIAAVYARLDYPKLAETHFQQAEAGIKKVLNKYRERELPDWLPRSVYAMSHVNDEQLAQMDFQQLVKWLKAGQNYLIRTIELDQDPWADMAFKDLQRAYDRLFALTSEGGYGPGPLRAPAAIPSSSQDPQKEALKLQLKRKNRAEKSLNLAVRLEYRTIPEVTPQRQEQLKEFIATTQRRFQGVMLEPPVASQLTPEAKEKQMNLRKPGKVISDWTELEEQSEKREPLP